MKKLTILLLCLFLTSCYFGQNESSDEIIKNFHLARWDENTWISYTEDNDSIFEDEKIVVGHNVFAIGNNENFIIGKQHPCENKNKHFIDYDSLKPNRKVINYFIIDNRNDTYKLYNFSTEKDFNIEKTRLGIPKSLPYQFYDKNLE